MSSLAHSIRTPIGGFEAENGRFGHTVDTWMHVLQVPSEEYEHDGRHNLAGEDVHHHQVVVECPRLSQSVHVHSNTFIIQKSIYFLKYESI